MMPKLMEGLEAYQAYLKGLQPLEVKEPLELLRWAVVEGCPCDSKTCSAAAGKGHLEVLQWARAKRAMLCARPWLAELPFVAAPHGPNWLAWLEALMEPLSRTSPVPVCMTRRVRVSMLFGSSP